MAHTAALYQQQPGRALRGCGFSSIATDNSEQKQASPQQPPQPQQSFAQRQSAAQQFSKAPGTPGPASAPAPVAAPAPAAPAEPAPAVLPPPPQFPSMDEDDTDVVMKTESDADTGEETNRPHWMKLKVPGMKKLTKKEKRRRQNQHLRRIITPKNALMVLNEMVLHEQLTNQFRVEPSDGPAQYYKSQKTSFCADLTVDGVTYKGYGENKLMARNAAAEQAIRALIIKRMARATPDAAEAEAIDEDPLPMIQLASYALHKLFSEWEYEGHKVPQLKMPLPSTSEQDPNDILAAIPPKARVTLPKPPKRLPLNASAMHPCMLLTYMRPQLEYRELAVEGDRPQNMLFTMGVDVDGATYVGKAPNKKEARKAAARAACTALFAVRFDDAPSASAPQPPPELPA